MTEEITTNSDFTDNYNELINYISDPSFIRWIILGSNRELFEYKVYSDGAAIYSTNAALVLKAPNQIRLKRGWHLVKPQEIVPIDFGVCLHKHIELFNKNSREVSDFELEVDDCLSITAFVDGQHFKFRKDFFTIATIALGSYKVQRDKVGFHFIGDNGCESWLMPLNKEASL